MQKHVIGRIALCAAIAALSACGDSNGGSGAGASVSNVRTPATSSSSTASSPTPATATPPATSAPAATARSSVKLSAAAYSVGAAAGTAVLTVERVGTSGTTAIDYATSNGSGVSGVDYTPASGTLTWSDGDASIKKIYVSVGSKASGKTFRVALAAANSTATVASPNVATVTVTAPAEALPPAAELAGYLTQTFGGALSMGDNWHNMSFFGWGGAGGVNNGDGSVTISGAGSGTIATAQKDTSKPNKWSGVAFGGGAYFEATFSFENATNEKLTPRWPAFWANDIENMAANVVTDQTQWQGQAEGFGNWVEADFMEYDRQNTGEYGIQIHNWYGFHVKGQIKDTHAWNGPVKVPAGFKWNEMHKYGFLWVPATATSQGYAQAYLDDMPVGSPVYWNKYDPKAPPSPLLGTSAFSVMDARHMALIFDTGPQNPMTIQSVKVWQKSSANNLTQ